MATTTSPTVPPVVAKRPMTFWRIIGKVIGWLFKAIVALTIIVILTPIAFFAWRAGQPMVLPEFGGMTYYEVISERNAALHNKAVAFQQAHPDRRMWLNQCIAVESWTNTIAIPLVGYATFRNMIDPDNSYYSTPYGPAERISDLLPTWWKNYEALLIGSYTHVHPVAYCNIATPVGP